MTSGVAVGDRHVGPGAPCFVIAEIGVNHNGSLDMAHRLIDAAAAAGVDCVKFQTFEPSRLAAQDAAAAPYQERNLAAVGSQQEMLTELALPDEAWPELARHAEERGLVFLSTAFDLESAELIRRLGVPALKVPSGELNNLPFIRELASFALPLLISTGMGTDEEVALAADAGSRAPGVCLFHCVSSYPAPPDQCNLRSIPAMRDRFGVPVGWSDHTRGEVTSVTAVALGANLLEKHLTLDRSLPGPDHTASEDPTEFRRYVDAVRIAETALGDGRKRPVPAEEENRVHARRSLHAARPLAPGQRLERADVVALRPATGLPPDTPLSGLRVLRELAPGSPVTKDDVESVPEGADV